MKLTEPQLGRWLHAITDRLPMLLLLAAWVMLLGFGDVFRGASCLLLYVTLEREGKGRKELK